MTPERWKQIDQLFEAALEIAAERRSAFLQEKCAGDDELRKEVETLLSSEHDAGSSIDGSPKLVAASLFAQRFSGTQFAGRYQILSSLGAGGMGEVYRAKDLRLDRDVAIKVLPEHLAGNPNALLRFEREAKAVAALSHPNILAIYDFESDHGVSFAVMELLEGETLRQRMKERLDCDRAIEIAMFIAEGLSAAHSKGVIHRDLKPENIFITSDGQVKILDFGLAQLRPNKLQTELSKAQTQSQLTQSGLIMGTIPYMSPEQVRGEHADIRTDIFSFGSMFYEMLSGKHAFIRRTNAETISAILNENPPDLLELVSGIPIELNQILQQCIQKNPDQRFHTSRDLAAALKSASTSTATTVHPASTFSFIKWPALLLFALAIIGGSIYLSSTRGKPFHSLAILPFTNASANPETEYLSDGISESIIANISQLPDLKVMARDTVFTYKNRQGDPRKIGRDLKVEAVVTGRILQHGDTLVIYAHLVNVDDGTELWGQQFNRKIADVISIQEEISREISNNLRLKLTGEQQKLIAKHPTENSEAYKLYLKGRYHWYKFTQEDYEKAIEYFQQAIQKDPNYALAYAGLSHTYSSMAFEGYSPPATACNEARVAARKVNEIDSSLAEAHYALAVLAVGCDWDLITGEREYKRAIELNSNLYYARRFLAHVLRNLGRWQDAITQSKEAQELDPLSPETTYAFGATYYWAGQYDKAIEQHQKAIDLDPNFAKAHDGLADAYARKKMYPEAIAEEQEYLRLAADGEGAEILGKDFEKYGYQKAKQRQFERALQFYDGVVQEQYVSPIFFAIIYAQLNLKDQAFIWLEKAYQEHAPWLVSLKTDPQFENLRSDSRFTDLVKRIGL
jgi:serine/threonine protein kinase/Tfp pilus assembly protein PilF